MRFVEILVLLLVVAHYARLLPKELRELHEEVMRLVECFLGEHVSRHDLEVVTALLMVLASAVVVSPALYYTIEVTGRMIPGSSG